MDYREDLPADCPPEASLEIVNATTVFRLVSSNPATVEDFRSQRSLKPDREFNGISECQACGLSVHTDKRDSAIALKLPTQRGRKICCVTLPIGAGRIQQTAKPSHHTWWPCARFDILANCEVETV